MATPTSTPNYNNNPASAGGIVSSDPNTIASTIAAMQKQAIAKATPVAQAAENARLSGQVTAQQAEQVKNQFGGSEETPLVVSSAKQALNDLAQKKDFASQLTQGMADQSANKANLAAAAQAPATNADETQQPEAPSAMDVAGELMKSIPDVAGTEQDAGTQTDTGQPDYQAQLDDINKKTDDAFAKYNQDMDSLRQGTFPLTADQQAQVDATKATFNRMIEAQKLANQNYTGAVNQAVLASGRSRYAPELALGEVQNSISAGISKIADIEAKAQDSLTQLKQGFDDRNYKLINDQYDKLNGYLKEKSDTISGIMKAVQDHADKAAELAQKSENDRITNTLKIADYNQKEKQQAFDQAMASDKFDYQQKQDAIKNMMDSDKFTWQQKQDNIQNALDNAKFSYQQKNDLRQYQLDVQKMQNADTPASYKEWKLAGQPGSYADYLNNKVNAKPPTEAQSKANGFLIRASDSGATISALTPGIFDGKTGTVSATSAAAQLWKPTFMQSAEAQRLGQAELDFVNAVLRPESGAAIATSEFTNAEKQYFPQPGDDQETIDQKARARLNKMKGLAGEAGSAVDPSMKKALDEGRLNYTSLDDYVRANPSELDAIKKMGDDNPNWQDDDILQVLQSGGDSGGNGSDFSNDLGTSEKGPQDLEKLMGAIGQYESGGNYKALGPVMPSGAYEGDRAYGKYQVMGKNVPSWTKQALGKSMTPQQFLNDTKAQDAVARYFMGQHLDKYGTPEDVAAIWLSGKPLAGNTRTDLATGVSVPQYVKNVMKNYNNA
jgi:hypothetical protein